MTARALLYLADLRRLSVSDASLYAVVNAEERARVARFRRAEDRRRYLIGRSLIRGRLAEALGVSPHEVHLRFGHQGKPFIDRGPAFNLSHSGDYVLVGIAEGGRFGVDVEQHSAQPEIDELMQRCFSDWEIARVGKLDAEARRRAFFRIWARKEALLKALGGGLSIELKRVSMDHAPMAHNALCALDLPAEDVHEWTVLPVEVGTEAAAAVAWDRPDFEFEIRQVRDADLENVIRALAT